MIVTAIEQQKNDKSRYSVFIDGAFTFGMSGEDILFFKVKEGAAIDEARLAYLLENVVFAEAKKKAVRYLSYSPKTGKELADKLHLLNYPPQIIEEVMDNLLNCGYIDDAKYAQKYINDKMRRGYGGRRIRMELSMKGIDRELVDEAFRQDENSEMDIIIGLLYKKVKNLENFNDKDKQKIYNYLINRGFAYSDINEAMLAFGEENK